MKLLIDADGCPVTGIAVGLAARKGIECLVVCDTAHMFSRLNAQVITVDKGADAADFALVNKVMPGDIVVTQDYGLAAMCLSKNALVLHQDGYLYTQENIQGLLTLRAQAARIRRGGARMKGPRKRTAARDEAFTKALCKLLEELP